MYHDDALCPDWRKKADSVSTAPGPGKVYATGVSDSDGSGSRLQIETFVCGPLSNNVYLITAPGSQHALAIDPAIGATAVLLPALRERGLTLELVVATHAHWDHVAEARALMDATGAPLAAHRLDAPRIAHPVRPTLFPDMVVPPAPVARELEEGDTITLGQVRCQVLLTPGHTPGSLCLYLAEEALLWSGDTVFAGSFGRYDLPGGDADLLRASLLRLATLPGKTAVFPGHGPATSLEEEPWLRQPPL